MTVLRVFFLYKSAATRLHFSKTSIFQCYLKYSISTSRRDDQKNPHFRHILAKGVVCPAEGPAEDNKSRIKMARIKVSGKYLQYIHNMV